MMRVSAVGDDVVLGGCWGLGGSGSGSLRGGFLPRLCTQGRVRLLHPPAPAPRVQKPSVRLPDQAAATSRPPTKLTWDPTLVQHSRLAQEARPTSTLEALPGAKLLKARRQRVPGCNRLQITCILRGAKPAATVRIGSRGVLVPSCKCPFGDW